MLRCLAPNATHQARGTAGARHERTLFPVACMRLLAGPGKRLSPLKTLVECRDERCIALEGHLPLRDGLLRADASIHQQYESLPITAERDVRRRIANRFHV